MFRFASSIGLALALADLKRRFRYFVRTGILAAVGVLFGVLALSFFLVAAHLYLSGLLNPVASAAIIGGILLAIALILLFIASRPMKARPRAPQEAESAGGVSDAIGEGFARLGQAAGASGSPLRNPLFQAAGLALIAGIFLGRRTKRDRD